MNISLFKQVLVFNTLYILILLIAWGINSELINKGVSFLPVLLVLHLLTLNMKAFRYLKISSVDFFIIVTLLIGSMLHLIFTPHFAIADFVKFIFIFFLFYISKYGVNKYKLIDYNLFFVAMFILPILCLLVYTYDTIVFREATNPVLFFSNRNNAIAYTFVCIFVLSAFTNILKNAILTTLIVTVLYGTLGALLAVILAFSFTMLKWTLSTFIKVLALICFVALMFVYIELDIFIRVRTVISGLINFFEVYSLSDLKHVNFGQIVTLQNGSDDVSMFFRLKHWGEILSILITDYSNIIFGWGMGASVELTSMSLVPHNDWLRVLFELGIFNFISFTLLNAAIFIRLKSSNKFLAALFLTLCIFMFSENLINNFLIISFLYFSCGLFFKNENIKYRA